MGLLSAEAMERLRLRQEKRATLGEAEYRRFMESRSRVKRYREIWGGIIMIENVEQEQRRIVRSPANNGVFRKKQIFGG